MKINFKFVPLDDNRKPKSEIDTTHLVGVALLSPHFSGDLIKRYDLSFKIGENKEVELDDADFSFIQKALENKESGVYPVYAGQILKHMNNEKLKQTK